MAALLGFAPFIVFALVEKLQGVLPALACGALASVLLMARERLRGARQINILEAGSALMFTALTGLALVRGAAAWSIWSVRLWVDGGLLLIVAFSMAIRRPFTLQHARHGVSAEVARGARFLHTNQVISGAWALAFLVLVAADLLMVLRPDAPSWVAVGLSLGALAAAAGFTRCHAAAVSARAAGARRGVGYERCAPVDRPPFAGT